ncbi:ORF46 [callitrichine gammaherpesvirus 3]|uniref:ORF46 n=1 Tax=callitrichine gammaherpesvirus 3 TaxID=106331 RepID=Q993G3_9GAMA|nr:ORF46 [callitrichine gammaherpesvirus 3]AAK38255.1 ORF46 [callitrichine gammaherpesvirus 3]
MFSIPAMASSKKSKGTAEGMSMEELVTRLTRLEMENKTLKNQVKSKSQSADPIQSPPGGGRTREVLTARQKQVLITQAISRLSSQAMQKIEQRVVAEMEDVRTRDEAEQKIQSLTIRIQVSMSCSKCGTGPSSTNPNPRSQLTVQTRTRHRSKSRGRD